MRKLSSALFGIVGLVNLIPVTGVVSAGRLERLYGVALDEPNLVILMRHRAVLFAIVGALLVVAAFREALRPVAVAAGLFSMLSFVVIAYASGGANAELQRVVLVDLVASLLLVGAAVAGRC